MFYDPYGRFFSEAVYDVDERREELNGDLIVAERGGNSWE